MAKQSESIRAAINSQRDPISSAAAGDISVSISIPPIGIAEA
jgi:hypothetical protein